MKKERYELTESQKVLLKKMKAFLDGPERVFLLTGKPGVGKTFMLRILLSEYIKSDRNISMSNSINVAGITLAHRAKKILGESIPQVFTFAKAFGMKEVIDEETGKREFVVNNHGDNRATIGDMMIPIFVHDEVSQYTKNMLDIVYDRTSVFSKIIFVGDRAQLPPIEESNNGKKDEDSPIFYYDIPEECKHELTERVRQAKGNPLLDLTDLMRDEIFGSHNVRLVLEAIYDNKFSNGQGWKNINYSMLNDYIKNIDPMKSCLVAYRNKTVNFFNNQIRKYLMGNPVDELINGDIICMSDNYYSDDDETVFYNSDVFMLEDVYVCVHKENVLKGYSFDVYKARKKGTSQNFVAPTAQGRIVYKKMLDDVAQACRKRELKWEVFWKLKDRFCKYTYGYCLTAYKVQGSTYDRVYVDINDIMLTAPLTPKRQLQTMYTAATRARNDVYFLTNKKT